MLKDFEMLGFMAIPYFASDATVIGCEIKPEGR